MSEYFFRQEGEGREGIKRYGKYVLETRKMNILLPRKIQRGYGLEERVVRDVVTSIRKDNPENDPREENILSRFRLTKNVKIVIIPERYILESGMTPALFDYKTEEIYWHPSEDPASFAVLMHELGHAEQHAEDKEILKMAHNAFLSGPVPNYTWVEKVAERMNLKKLLPHDEKHASLKDMWTRLEYLEAKPPNELSQEEKNESHSLNKRYRQESAPFTKEIEKEMTFILEKDASLRALRALKDLSQKKEIFILNIPVTSEEVRLLLSALEKQADKNILYKKNFEDFMLKIKSQEEITIEQFFTIALASYGHERAFDPF